VATDTKEETKVDAKSTDISTSLAADPEDTEVAVIVKLNQLALVDRSDTELTLDGRNKRGALEQSTGESLESAGKLSLAAGQLVMETDDGNIFLSGSLLGLDEAGGAVDADNQAASDLGIEGTTVTSLFASTDSNQD
jgi:hypothetical protein